MGIIITQLFKCIEVGRGVSTEALEDTFVKGVVKGSIKDNLVEKEPESIIDVSKMRAFRDWLRVET